MVSEARHKTIAGLYRLIVEAPDPSNGADTLRISPWTAEDLRAPIRHFIMADLVAYAHQSNQWTLYVSLDSRFAQMWRSIPDYAKLWACMRSPISSQSASTTFRC